MDAKDRLLLARERAEATKLELRSAAREASAGGMTVREIGKLLRLSKSRVHQLLDEPILVQETGQGTVLGDLPPVVAELVRTCALTPEVARQLDKLADKQVVVRLAADAVEWNWTRSQAVAVARARGAELDPEDLVVMPQPRLAQADERPAVVGHNGTH